MMQEGGGCGALNDAKWILPVLFEGMHVDRLMACL